MKRYKNVGTSIVLDDKAPGQEFEAELDAGTEGFLISIGALEVLERKQQPQQQPSQQQQRHDRREGGKK